MERETLAILLQQQLRIWAEAGLTHLPSPRTDSMEFLAANRYEPQAGSSVAAVQGASSAEPTYLASAPEADPTRVGETATNWSRGEPGAKESGNEAPVPPLAPNPPRVPASPPPQPSSDVDLRPYPPAEDASSRVALLNELAQQVAGCQRCEILTKCRTQTVFGVGNPQARLCFLGEAPGADEDRLGEPFVGAAGQLLDRILAACKISRRDVYILNTVKCRPPQNRNPSEQELTNCWAYAERQLELLQPEFICCLGRIAAQALLKTQSSISRLRKSFHPYRGSQVIVTYHPAYLLRTPSAKKQTWEDMQMLMKAMGHPIN